MPHKKRVVARKRNVVRPKTNRKSTRSSSKPFAAVGQKIGSLLGPTASAVGRLAGSAIGSIFGSGDYSVARRSSSALSNSVPSFKSQSGGSCFVTHREFIGTVDGDTAPFSLAWSLPLNPGQSVTFPWLSGLAANFQEYEFQGLVFEFVSTSGIISSTSSLGTVIMGTNYDPTAPQFSTKQDMESYQFTTSNKPSSSFLHAIECKPNQSLLRNNLIRTSAFYAGDLRLYDLGLFQVFTDSNSNTGPLGDLWVTYSVKLMKPKMSSVVGYSHYVESPAHSASPTNPFGSSGGVASIGSSLNVYTEGNSVILPAGNWLLLYGVHTSGGVITGPMSWTPGPYTSVINVLTDDTASSIIPTGSSLNVQYVSFVCLSSTQELGQVALGNLGSGWTGSSDLFAFPLPGLPAPDLVTLKIRAEVEKMMLSSTISTYEQLDHNRDEKDNNVNVNLNLPIPRTRK